jgi:putative ATPase
LIALDQKYQPESITDFIGIKVPKAIMLRLIAEPYESAFLFTGPSGTGKTTLAFVVAREIGGQMHHIRATECTVDAVERIYYDCQFAPMLSAARWHVYVIDEVDTMSAQAQKAMLSLLDTTARPPNGILLMTSNATVTLHDRFLSRLRVLRFSTPSDEEFSAFLAGVWAKETPPPTRRRRAPPAPDFLAIAKAAKGNLRTALLTLETELLEPGSFEAMRPPEPPIRIAAPAARRMEPARIAVVSSLDKMELRQRALALFNQGVSVKTIGQELGQPSSTIWRWTHGKVVGL